MESKVNWRYSEQRRTSSLSDNYDFPHCGKCGAKHPRANTCPPPGHAVFCYNCKQVHPPDHRYCLPPPKDPCGNPLEPCKYCWGFGAQCCTCFDCNNQSKHCRTCHGEYWRPPVKHRAMDYTDMLELKHQDILFDRRLQENTMRKALAWYQRMQSQLAILFLGPPGIGKSALATAVQALLYYALDCVNIFTVPLHASAEHISDTGYCGDASRAPLHGANQHAGLFRQALQQARARILLLEHNHALANPERRRDTLYALPRAGGLPGHRVVFVSLDKHTAPNPPTELAIRRLAARKTTTIAAASGTVTHQNKFTKPLTPSEKQQARQVIALDPRQPVHALAFELLGLLDPLLNIPEITAWLQRIQPAEQATCLEKALKQNRRITNLPSLSWIDVDEDDEESDGDSYFDNDEDSDDY